MPNLKISQLTNGGPVQAGDLLPVARSGANFRVTASSLAAFAISPLAGSWWNNGDGSPYAFSPNGGTIGSSVGGTDNLALFYMFQLPIGGVFFRLAFRQLGLGGAGSKSGFGIYDITGATKLMSWDAIDTNTGTTDRNVTLAQAITLSPGVYIFAFGRSGGTNVPSTDSGYATSGSSDNSESWNKGGFVRSGQAANPLVVGVMPSSLGALSSSTNMANPICQVTVSPT